MSLSISHSTLADCRIQSINIRPLLGAYELCIGMMFDIRPATANSRGGYLIGGRVSVQGEGGVRDLGFAHPDTPCRIEPKQGFPTSATPSFSLPLSNEQIAALETFRNGGDLGFTIQLRGEAQAENGVESLYDDPALQVPSSKWIQLLNQAGATNTVLLEVPLPVGELSDEWDRISRSFRRAQNHFAQGDYRSAISQCREITEELGHMRYDTHGWVTPSLKNLAAKETREGMTAEEREAALWAAIQHYTHLSHHSESKFGEDSYTRSEAQQILTLTASIIARYQTR